MLVDYNLLPVPSIQKNEDAGTRTQDLRIKSPLLYRLSYVLALEESRTFLRPCRNFKELMRLWNDYFSEEKNWIRKRVISRHRILDIDRTPCVCLTAL